MTTAVVSPHTTDLPIVVQDRRRRGFYTIDNEIIDRYGMVLKAHGVAVYSVLARFTNREGECFPSQATIAKRLGMSRMQVSREINKLQQLHLIEVKPQFGPNGEQRSNLYILLDIVKPDEPVKHRYTPGNRELPPPVTDSDTLYNRRLHKQNTFKKTQTEQDLEQAVVVAGCAASSNLLEKEEATETTQDIRESWDENHLSAALVAHGLAKAVAHNLVQHYEAAYLQEKLDYLKFLQATQPARVLKPCGWLRKAIENDYAAPDGYVALEEQVIERIELQHLEAVLEQEFAAHQQQKAEAHTQQAQQATAQLAALQATYGTTEQEFSIWGQILDEFRMTLPTTTFSRYLADTVLLTVQAGEALIGLPTLQGCDWLANRFGQKLAYALAAQLGGQPYTVKFIDLSLLKTE